MATTRVLNMNDSSVITRAGKLLKHWIDTDSAPTDGADAKAALEGVGVIFAGFVTEVNVHPYKPNSVEVALPNKNELQERLDEFDTPAGRNNYELANPFEFQIDRGRDGPPQSKQELIEFYMFRLGDYALQHCQ